MNVFELAQALRNMTDQQLVQLAQQHQNDAAIMAAVMNEKTSRDKLRASASAAPAPQGQQPTVREQMLAGLGNIPTEGMTSMADGGIVSFDGGGSVWNLIQRAVGLGGESEADKRKRLAEEEEEARRNRESQGSGARNFLMHGLQSLADLVSSPAQAATPGLPVRRPVSAATTSSQGESVLTAEQLKIIQSLPLTEQAPILQAANRLRLGKPKDGDQALIARIGRKAQRATEAGIHGAAARMATGNTGADKKPSASEAERVEEQQARREAIAARGEAPSMGASGLTALTSGAEVAGAGGAPAPASALASAPAANPAAPAPAPAPAAPATGATEVLSADKDSRIVHDSGSAGKGTSGADWDAGTLDVTAQAPSPDIAAIEQLRAAAEDRQKREQAGLEAYQKQMREGWLPKEDGSELHKRREEALTKEEEEDRRAGNLAWADALISMGAAMMSSKSPTFFGGLGEGVKAGAEEYARVRDRLAARETRRQDLLMRIDEARTQVKYANAQEKRAFERQAAQEQFNLTRDQARDLAKLTGMPHELALQKILEEQKREAEWKYKKMELEAQHENARKVANIYAGRAAAYSRTQEGMDRKSLLEAKNKLLAAIASPSPLQNTSDLRALLSNIEAQLQALDSPGAKQAPTGPANAPGSWGAVRVKP